MLRTFIVVALLLTAQFSGAADNCRRVTICKIFCVTSCPSWLCGELLFIG